MSLHTLDPGGDTFRYSTTYDKAWKRFVPTPRPDSTHIDVVAMVREFDAVVSLIGGGLSTVLDQYREWQAEMFADTGSFERRRR